MGQDGDQVINWRWMLEYQHGRLAGLESTGTVKKVQDLHISDPVYGVIRV